MSKDEHGEIFFCQSTRFNNVVNARGGPVGEVQVLRRSWNIDPNDICTYVHFIGIRGGKLATLYGDPAELARGLRRIADLLDQSVGVGPV